MKSKVTPQSPVSEILGEHAYISPMSLSLADSVINLVGGDKTFISVHEKILSGDAAYKLYGMFSEKEVYGFYLLNRDTLIEYGEAMVNIGGVGYDSLIESIKKEGAGNNYSLDEIARALYGSRNDISAMRKVDSFVASYLTELVITKACKEYAKMLNNLGYKNFIARYAAAD